MTNELRPSIPAVVVLDDDPNDVFFVRRTLQRTGITNPVSAFAGADQARRHVKGLAPETLPVLFILDVALEGPESGLDFLRWLRRQRLPLGATPAMMLTGSERFTDQDEAAMLGSIYFLRKPITEQDLMTAVQSLRLVGTLAGTLTHPEIEPRR